MTILNNKWIVRVSEQGRSTSSKIIMHRGVMIRAINIIVARLTGQFNLDMRKLFIEYHDV